MKPFAKTIIVVAALVTLLNGLLPSALAQNLGRSPADQLAIKTQGAGGLFGPLSRPDLVIEPRFGDAEGQIQTGFCDRQQNEPVLSMRIRNIGQSKAPASKVKVNWGRHGSAHYPVGPLQPGQARIVTAPVPAQITRNGVASFSITADIHAQVFETHEHNNTASGQCDTNLPAPHANRF